MPAEISHIITRLFTSSFLRNTGKMVSGTGLAHLIGLAVLPVITRLYSPAEIGVFSVYLSVYTIGFTVASLRYEYATLLPKTEQGANNITMLSLLLSFCVSALMYVVLLAGSAVGAGWLSFGELHNLVWLLPVSVFSFSTFMILTFRLNREQQYAHMATAKVAGSAGTAGGQATLGFAGYTSWGMVAGKVAGDLLGMFYLLWQRRRWEKPMLYGVSKLRMAAMAKRYRHFPMWNLPHALTTAANNNIPVLLFYAFFSGTTAGFFAMAMRILTSPLQMVARAAYQVFSQRVAQKHNNKDRIYPFFKQTAGLFAVSGMVPFVLLFWTAPALFSWFLGAEWVVTGEYIRILTPYVFVSFVVSPLNFIPLMLGKQQTAFVIDLIHLILRLLAIAAGLYMQSMQVVLIGYSLVGVLAGLVQLLWYTQLSRKADTEVPEPVPPIQIHR